MTTNLAEEKTGQKPRYVIVAEMRNRPMTPTEIARRLSISLDQVQRALLLARDKGLLKREFCPGVHASPGKAVRQRDIPLIFRIKELQQQEDLSHDEIMERLNITKAQYLTAMNNEGRHTKRKGWPDLPANAFQNDPVAMRREPLMRRFDGAFWG